MLCRGPNCEKVKITHNSWTKSNILLKVCIHIDINTTYATGLPNAICRRSRLCRGPHSEIKWVKLALSLEQYGIFWLTIAKTLILTRSSTEDCQIPLTIDRGFCRGPNCEKVKLALYLKPCGIFFIKFFIRFDIDKNKPKILLNIFLH